MVAKTNKKQGDKPTWVYKLSINDKAFYVGQTGSLKNRESKHREDISKKKHKCKQLNKVEVNDVDFIPLAKINTDCSLIVMLVEALFNVLEEPYNSIVWVGFRASVTFKRCDKKTAQALLDCLVAIGMVELL